MLLALTTNVFFPAGGWIAIPGRFCASQAGITDAYVHGVVMRMLAARSWTEKVLLRLRGIDGWS